MILIKAAIRSRSSLNGSNKLVYIHLAKPLSNILAISTTLIGLQTYI
jgi:hypothetical protein